MFPTLETTLGSLYLLVLNVAVVLAILVIWEPQTLIRKERKMLKRQFEESTHLKHKVRLPNS